MFETVRDPTVIWCNVNSKITRAQFEGRHFFIRRPLGCLGIAELKKRRTAEDKPITDMYLGLHVGEVFYGNVGSRERLDFTVLGPAVNEASRIAAMCRSVEQPVLMSAAFANVGDIKRRLVSVGRYALRGVFLTLDPDAP